MPKHGMMTMSPTDGRRRTDELVELREAVERLSQIVSTLTQAVDEMTVELQWRNNSLRDSSPPASPPFVLHDMPRDPAVRDWHINRHRAERNDASQPETQNRRQDIEQLCKEFADLRQIVAALALIALEGSPDVEIYDLVYAWACQEFDAEIMQEIFGESDDSAERPVTKPPSEQQRELFSANETDAAEDI